MIYPLFSFASHSVPFIQRSVFQLKGPLMLRLTFSYLFTYNGKQHCALRRMSPSVLSDVTTGVSQTRTCVEVEDPCCLPLHSDRHVVPLDVSSADASVRQLDLKQTAAALHVVVRHVAETRLDVRLVGVEGLMENVLHDLDDTTGTVKGHFCYFHHDIILP